MDLSAVVDTRAWQTLNEANSALRWVVLKVAPPLRSSGRRLVIDASGNAPLDVVRARLTASPPALRFLLLRADGDDVGAPKRVKTAVFSYCPENAPFGDRINFSAASAALVKACEGHAFHAELHDVDEELVPAALSARLMAVGGAFQCASFAWPSGDTVCEGGLATNFRRAPGESSESSAPAVAAASLTAQARAQACEPPLIAEPTATAKENVTSTRIKTAAAAPVTADEACTAAAVGAVEAEQPSPPAPPSRAAGQQQRADGAASTTTPATASNNDATERPTASSPTASKTAITGGDVSPPTREVAKEGAGAAGPSTPDAADALAAQVLLGDNGNAAKAFAAQSTPSIAHAVALSTTPAHTPVLTFVPFAPPPPTTPLCDASKQEPPPASPAANDAASAAQRPLIAVAKGEGDADFPIAAVGVVTGA